MKRPPSSLCSCSNKTLNTVEPPVPPRSPSDLPCPRKSCVHRRLLCDTHATCDNNLPFCDNMVSSKNRPDYCTPNPYTTFQPFLPNNFFSISSQNHRPNHHSLTPYHPSYLLLDALYNRRILASAQTSPRHYTHQPSKPYGRSKNPMRLRSEIRL